MSDNVGINWIYLSFNGYSFTNTSKTLETVGDPYIIDITPKVILVNNEYTITITGTDFNP